MMYETNEVEVSYPSKKRYLAILICLIFFSPIIATLSVFFDWPLWGLILYSVLPLLVFSAIAVTSAGIEVAGGVLGFYAGITVLFMILSVDIHWSLGIISFFVISILFVYYFQKYFEDKKIVTKKKVTTHGSAEWASSINQHISEKGKQFLLGRFRDEKGQEERFYQAGHMLTCAPSGAGKGIGAVIPNLLEYVGSVFCVDIKGENYAVTAARRRILGQTIALVDPFGVTGSEEQDAFNIMDWIKAFPDDLTSDSQMIADALVVVGSNGDSDFWNDSARDLLRGIIAYVSKLDDPMRSNLGEVRRIVTMARNDFQDVLEDMQQSSVPVVSRCANTMLSMDEKTRAGILTTSQQQTAFLDEERITRVLSCSTFDISKFKTGAMSVYLVMPPERLSSNFRLIRLFISLLITSVTRIKERPQIPALFMLDEFAQLGRMSLLEDSLSLIRGYGASYWFIIQDLSQLKSVYQKWQTFLANTTKQFFSTSDYDTAKYISDMLGQTTEGFISNSSSSSTSMSGGSVSSSSGSSTAENRLARNLLNPDEVMRLPKDDVLVFTRGEDAYKLKLVNYLTDGEFAGTFNPNPMH